jgi:hypothetical protein
MCRRFDAPQLGKATPDDATGQPRTDGEVVEDGPTPRRARGETCSLHRPMRQPPRSTVARSRAMLLRIAEFRA